MNMKMNGLLLTLVACSFLSIGCTPQERATAERKTDNAAETAERKMENAAEKTGRTMDNAATTTAVKTKLAADVRMSTLATINVDSMGSTVTLSGTVPTAADKEKAEAVAKTAEGVTTVVNNLTVKP
jgi:hyperosmotically inducible protein